MVHRKAVSINKKGITLETAVALILIVISLAIVIILLFTTGLISNLQAVICTTLTSAGSVVRGFVIQQIWVIFGWLLIIVAGVLATGSTCRAFPYGTAVCAATYAIFVVILTLAFNGLTAALPLVYCPNPVIIHGQGSCTEEGGVSNATFFREMADRSVDCWAMYGSGHFDPLSGRVPPNPITCFIINFKLNQSVSMSDIATWMSGNTYSKGVSYWSKVGGVIIPQNNNKDIWNEKIKSGRIFIKYGDDYIFTKWGSADCSISGSYSPPSRVDVLDEFYNNIADNAKECITSCDKALLDGTKCSIPTDCALSCLYVPQECPTECIYRNQPPHVDTCSVSCIAEMGKCASYCMDSITNCQQNAFDDALNCGKSCAVPPHAFPLLEGVWKSLTTTKDYVYWCIDKSVTCDENCQSEVTSAYDTVFCAGGGSCTGCDLKGGVNLKSSGLALDGFTSVFGDMKYYQCPATAGSWSPVPGGDYSCEIGKCGKLILATGTAPTKIPCVTG